MKFVLVVVVLGAMGFAGVARGIDVVMAIPEGEAALVRSTDMVEVSGTNDAGGAEEFTVHDAKAIKAFVGFLTSERFVAVPKSLKPEFKSLSAYDVKLSSNGAEVLELRVLGDSVLDFPQESSFYMEAERFPDNLMAPLLRVR
jgi:hypothetical protein